MILFIAHAKRHNAWKNTVHVTLLTNSVMNVAYVNNARTVPTNNQAMMKRKESMKDITTQDKMKTDRK